MFPTTSIFEKIYDKNNKNNHNVWRIKLYLSFFFILYKNCFSTSVQAFFCPCYCKLQSFDKHHRTKNTLQIRLRQLPQPHLRSSSSKTTTIVRKQRYARIKYTCKAVHLQKIKLFGRGQNTPLWRPP